MAAQIGPYEAEILKAATITALGWDMHNAQNQAAMAKLVSLGLLEKRTGPAPKGMPPPIAFYITDQGRKVSELLPAQD